MMSKKNDAIDKVTKEIINILDTGVEGMDKDSFKVFKMHLENLDATIVDQKATIDGQQLCIDMIDSENAYLRAAYKKRGGKLYDLKIRDMEPEERKTHFESELERTKEKK